MLADASLEMNQSLAELQPSLPTQPEGQPASLSASTSTPVPYDPGNPSHLDHCHAISIKNETHTTNKRTERNSQEEIQPNQSKELVGPTGQTRIARPLPRFGWEQIEDGPLLPFVARGSESFVALLIVLEKVFHNISAVFSREIINCASVQLYAMDYNEALTFNEINMAHCDRSLVGNTIFKPGDAMVTLDSMRQLVKFFHICRKLLLFGEKNNGLFGFVRVDEETEVPFIWHDNQKLVPLFYFEGINATAMILEDRWKICYLKFCFKMQKIREDLYKDIPLSVINFIDVEQHFPPGSNFELCCPKQFNQELLAPELRTVPPGADRRRKRSAEPSTLVHAKQARTDDSHFPPSQPSRNNSKNQPNPAQLIVPLEKPPLVKMSSQSVPSQRGVTITAANIQGQRIQQENLDYSQDMASITLIPNPEAEPCLQSHKVQIIETQQRHSLPTEVPILEVARPKERLQTFRRHVASSKLSQLAANTNSIPAISSEGSFTTNVPRKSPQVANSPGVRQTSPFMDAATEPAQQHSTKGDNMLSNSVPTRPAYQTGTDNNIYRALMHDVDMHQRQFSNYRNNQMGSDANVGNLLGGSFNTQNNAGPQKGRYKSAKSPARANKTKNPLPRSQTILAQADPSLQVPDRVDNNRTYNSVSIGYSSGSANEEAYGSLPDPSLRATLRQLCHEKALLNKQLNLNEEKWRQLKLQQYLQLQMGMNSTDKIHTPTNNHGNNTVSISTDFQNVRGTTTTFQQECIGSLRPVVQNVNVAVTNVVVTENKADYLSNTATSVTINKKCAKSQINEMSLPIVVPDHRLNIDTYLQTYSIKQFPVQNGSLAGIRLSLDSNDFLLNFSKLAEMASVTSAENQLRFLLTFKKLYKLNPIQNYIWSEMVKYSQLVFIGPYSDLFVNYNEVLSVVEDLRLKKCLP